LATGIILVGVVTGTLAPFHRHLSRSTPALAFVVAVVVGAVLGGRIPAIITAIVGALAFNVYFIPPFGTLRVALSEDVAALVVFIIVAIAVGTLVASETEHRRAAELHAEEVRALMEEQERLREEASRLAVLERVDQQRAALLRSVSHDLRTPLASIKAVASDLRSGTELAAPIRNELLDVVCEEAERLDRIVANLLSMSRIEAGVMQPDRQAVALDELCATVARRLARLFDGLELRIDVPAGLPLVDIDFVQIDQVLSNLLENAARHCKPGGTVAVCADVIGDAVEMSVVDEGAGIAVDDRAHLFEPFRTGAGSTSTGIGLAICKAIVEAHGGSITADNVPGRGARLAVTLPMRDGQ
jgi:two-component system sensor histidine kinase KdpD